MLPPWCICRSEAVAGVDLKRRELEDGDRRKHCPQICPPKAEWGERGLCGRWRRGQGRRPESLTIPPRATVTRAGYNTPRGCGSQPPPSAVPTWRGHPPTLSRAASAHTASPNGNSLIPLTIILAKCLRSCKTAQASGSSLGEAHTAQSTSPTPMCNTHTDLTGTQNDGPVTLHYVTMAFTYHCKK